MKQQVRKARQAFESAKNTPKHSCERCGITAAEFNDLKAKAGLKTAQVNGKPYQLQIHHVIPLREAGERGNYDDNYVTLCPGCHKEWHNAWEIAQRPFDKFMSTPSLLSQLL